MNAFTDIELTAKFFSLAALVSPDARLLSRFRLWTDFGSQYAYAKYLSTCLRPVKSSATPPPATVGAADPKHHPGQRDQRVTHANRHR